MCQHAVDMLIIELWVSLLQILYGVMGGKRSGVSRGGSKCEAGSWELIPYSIRQYLETLKGS